MLEPYEKEQLDRMETLLTDTHAKVYEHNGFIVAFKWLLGGIGAGITALLAKMGFS